MLWLLPMHFANNCIVFIRNSTTTYCSFLFNLLWVMHRIMTVDNIMKLGKIFCGGCPKPEKRRPLLFFSGICVLTSKKSNHKKLDYFIVHKILINSAIGEIDWTQSPHDMFWGCCMVQNEKNCILLLHSNPKKTNATQWPRNALHNGHVMRPTIINQAHKLQQCTNLGQLFFLLLYCHQHHPGGCFLNGYKREVNWSTGQQG